MSNINPAPSWADVRQLETSEYATGGANGNMNEQAIALTARTNLLAENITMPFRPKSGGYAVGERVTLANGVVVESTIVGNATNPNESMTGWQLFLKDKDMLTWSGRTQEEKNKEYVSLKDFGAVDSATEDSTESVRAYHTYCNNSNQSASYAGFKNLAIKDSANILVYTNLDMAGCEIVPINQGATSRATMYIVRDPLTPSEELTVNLLAENVGLLSRTPTKGVWENTGFCSIESAKQVCDRNNIGTTNYIQPFWMVRGEALKPLHLDLAGYTDNVILRVRKASKSRLIVSNLCLRDNGFTRFCFINVQRNQTDVNGFSIVSSSNRATDTLDQLITFNICGNCILSNFTSEGRPYSNGGTYGIRIDHGSKIRFQNVQGLNGIQGATWGVTGSNYISDVVAQDCHLNRFDVHAGGFDISYLGGTLADGSLLVGSGGGVFEVGGGCTVLNAPAFNARTDYGNHYENCTIIVDNITWLPPVNNIANNQALVNLGGNHEMGGKVPVTMPNTSINAINVLSPSGDLAQATCYLLSVRTKPDSIVYVPAFIDINEVTLPTRMRWGLCVDFASLERDGATVTTTRFDLNNIKGTAAGSYTSGINGTGIVDRPTPSKLAKTAISLSVTINNVYPLGAYFKNITPASITVNGAKITHLFSEQSVAFEYAIRNSSFYGNSSYDVVSKICGPQAVSNRDGVIQNCKIVSGGARYDLSSARFVSGTIANTADILPTGCTRATAFTGWSNDSLI